MIDANAFLAHHGVKGMKHGKRLYQNPDGTLTALGRIHYGYGKQREKKSAEKPEYSSGTSRYKGEDMRHLTDEELSKRTKRLTAENSYREAIKKNHEISESNRKKAFRKIFVDSAQNAAAEIMKTVYTNAGKNFLAAMAPGLMGVSAKKDNSGDSGKKNDAQQKKGDGKS